MDPEREIKNQLGRAALLKHLVGITSDGPKGDSTTPIRARDLPTLAEKIAIVEAQHGRRLERSYRHVSRRRAQMSGAEIVERIDREAIIARDGSRCYLCGELVDRDDIHLDHVVPLSRGGEHTAANLRVTHSVCNLVKSDKLLAECSPFSPPLRRAAGTQAAFTS